MKTQKQNAFAISQYTDVMTIENIPIALLETFQLLTPLINFLSTHIYI